MGEMLLSLKTQAFAENSYFNTTYKYVDGCWNCGAASTKMCFYCLSYSCENDTLQDASVCNACNNRISLQLIAFYIAGVIWYVLLALLPVGSRGLSVSTEKSNNVPLEYLFCLIPHTIACICFGYFTLTKKDNPLTDIKLDEKSINSSCGSVS